MNGLDWETAFKLLVGILFAIGAWVWKMLIAKVIKIDDDLNAHKLAVSENYAKKIELTPIYSKLDDIQNDIKQLLGRKQQRDE